MHGHLQPVALRVAVRVGDRARDGLPRLEPGPARASSTWSRSGRAERILDIAATQLPTGGAYHQYQPLTKRGNDAVGSGFNDDPAWLVLAVAAYLKETGDLAILDEPVPYDNAPGQRAAARRPPPAGDRLHARAARPARPAAHRPRRLERLPQPELLLGHARRVVPDDPEPRGRRRRVGLHRRPVRARGERAGRAIADHRGDGCRVPSACGRRPRGWSRRSTPTAGTAPGSGARTTSSASRSARPRTPRARSSSSPRASASWPGSASTTDGRSRALAAVRERLATPHGIVLQQPAFTTYELAPRRDLVVPARLQGERRDLLPHEPVADDRRGAGGQRRGRPRLLPADQPLGPGSRSPRSIAASRTSTPR